MPFVDKPTQFAKAATQARKALARRIRLLRRRNRWTQADLAWESRLGVRHIQRLERVEKPPAIELDSIVKLSKAFKITLSELMKF